MSEMIMTATLILPVDPKLDAERLQIRASLIPTKKGDVCCTIENCVTILQNDPLLKNNIRKNLLTGRINIYDHMPWHRDGLILVMRICPSSRCCSKSSMALCRKTRP